jgi:hypothetical protein
MPQRRKIIYALVLISIPFIVLGYYFWPRSEPIPITGGVAIVDSFYSSTPQFTDEALAFFASHDIQVTTFKDENVTVSLYEQLPEYGYRLIILRVHAGILETDPTRPTFMFTNERFNNIDYFTQVLAGQIQSGKTNPDDPTEEPVFTVGPSFITANSDFDNSIIVLSSCYGLYMNKLAEAFIQKGAEAFLSWDERVSLTHTDNACMRLLLALIDEEMTLEDAVDTVMIDVGPDLAYGSSFKYYPLEASNLVLNLL